MRAEPLWVGLLSSCLLGGCSHDLTYLNKGSLSEVDLGDLTDDAGLDGLKGMPRRGDAGNVNARDAQIPRDCTTFDVCNDVDYGADHDAKSEAAVDAGPT